MVNAARMSQARRATIHDVAKKAGVSAATVSKVLRNIGKVKEVNKLAVMNAVSELGYRMDPLASGLRGETRAIIGAIVPDLESSFFGALVTELERAAEDAGFHMIVASSRENEGREATLVARLDDWRVAGTVLVPVRSEHGLGVEQLRHRSMRAVLVDRVDAHNDFDTITSDNNKASAHVADYLNSLGHTHVLMHAATRVSKAVSERIKGFKERSKEIRASFRLSELVSDGQTEVLKRDINHYFEKLDRSEWPTAIYSLSQHSTLVILSELRRKGIRVPDDIALIGFDDADWMQTTWPSISVVSQPVKEIALAAMETLLARVSGEQSSSPISRRLSCSLLIRESTQKYTRISRNYGSKNSNVQRRKK